MPARQCQATLDGLALVAAGVPLREAARRVGVAPSTLVRARARAGLPALQRGRPDLARTALVRVAYRDSVGGATVYRGADVRVQAATESLACSRAVESIRRSVPTASGFRATVSYWI